MANVYKLDKVNSTTEQNIGQDINSLIPGNISEIQHRLSADQLEKNKQIELLEQQVDALYVVSKRLNSKEKQSTELLVQLKEKLQNLSEKQDDDSQSFSAQYEVIQEHILKLAQTFKTDLETYQQHYRNDQQSLSQHVEQQFETINQTQIAQSKQVSHVEAKTMQLDEFLHALKEAQQKDLASTQLVQQGLSTEQNGHTEQLDELREITQKLAHISDRLTDKVSLHEEKITVLEKDSHDQQQSINELFDQTHDLANEDANLLKKHEVLQADVTTLDQQHQNLEQQHQSLDQQHQSLDQQHQSLEQQHQNLEQQHQNLEQQHQNLEQQHLQLAASTEQLSEQQQLHYQEMQFKDQNTDKRFKMTQLVTATAFVIVAALASAYYVHNSRSVVNLQVQNGEQISQINSLDLQAQSTISQQKVAQQNILELEQRLLQLKQALNNNDIDMLSFEQQQDEIAVQLNQLASQVSLNQDAVISQIQSQTEKQKFYRSIQFVRPDNAPVFDQSWIDVQNNKHYSIQLMSSTNKTDVMSFIKTQVLDGDIAFRESNVNGTTWYSVINGVYPSKQLAQQALTTLPESVMSNKPWLRSFKKLKIIK